MEVSPRCRQPRRAFTLIELLVVIAIIGLLVGMLMPALVLVKDGAKTALCSNRYRQMAIMTDCYLTDNQMIYPPSQGWNGYTGWAYYFITGGNGSPAATDENAKMFFCGADPYGPTTVVPLGSGWGSGGTLWATAGMSHGYNTQGLGGSSATIWNGHDYSQLANRNEIRSPSATILSADTLQWAATNAWKNFGYAQALNGSVYPRHRRNTICNILWVDYHVSGVFAAQADDASSLNDPLRLGYCYDRD